MKTEVRQFHVSGGKRLAGFWRQPDNPDSSTRTVVHCPGWSGTADSPRYTAWHEVLTAAGFAVFAFDFAGRGVSSGVAPDLSLEAQISALEDAAHFVADFPEAAGRGIGLLGSGATGGSHVIRAATQLRMVDAVVSQFPIASGGEWIGSMLSAGQQEQLEIVMRQDRSRRAAGGPGSAIDFAGLRKGASPAAVDLPDPGDPPPGVISLELLESLLSYSPIDSAHRVLAPVLLISVKEDYVTPVRHVQQYWTELTSQRRLVLQQNVQHYEAYDKNAAMLASEMVSWFDRHVDVPAIVVDAPSD